MQIKELKTKEEILGSYDILSQIYENLDRNNYAENILAMMQNGYKMAVVTEDDKNDNNYIGIIGVKIGNRIAYGKSLEIEDFRIDRNKRGVGVGKMLIRWAEWQGAVLNCNFIMGSLATQRLESHKIFSREKFILEGLHFSKKC